LAALTGTNRKLERSLNANQTLVGVDPEQKRHALEVCLCWVWFVLVCCFMGGDCSTDPLL
jgi:hypothetical protein